MDRMSVFRQKVITGLPGFVLVLFVIQPLMDVLSFWMTEFEMSNTPTLLLRLGLLGLTVLAGFWLSERKWVYFAAVGIIGFLAAGHMYACWEFGYQSIFTDLSNYVRVVQMPVTALCLITFLRRNEGCYDAMKKGVVACLSIMLGVQVLAIVSGTEPHTYIDGTGYMGWFNNPNSQSANLSLLTPVAAMVMYQRYGFRNWKFWLVFLGGMVSMFFMGPRLCYLGIAATGIGLGVCMILIDPKGWKKALVFVSVALVLLGCLPLSPMLLHRDTHDGFQSGRQEDISAQLQDVDLPPLDEPGISDEELERRKDIWQEALSHVYNVHAWDFVLIFGQRETMEMYDFTYDITQLTALRPKKLKFAQLLQSASPASAKWFGMELSRFSVDMSIYGLENYGADGEGDVENYDVENDLHGIYFLYGAVGLGAMLAFLGYFLVQIVLALARDWKRYFTWDAAGWGIGLVMCLLHVYCTAGVLRRPNASFYLSATLAAVYYLVKIRKNPRGKENGA